MIARPGARPPELVGGPAGAEQSRYHHSAYRAKSTPPSLLRGAECRQGASAAGDDYTQCSSRSPTRLCADHLIDASAGPRNWLSLQLRREALSRRSRRTCDAACGLTPCSGACNGKRSAAVVHPCGAKSGNFSPQFSLVPLFFYPVRAFNLPLVQAGLGIKDDYIPQRALNPSDLSGPPSKRCHASRRTLLPIGIHDSLA